MSVTRHFIELLGGPEDGTILGAGSIEPADFVTTKAADGVSSTYLPLNIKGYKRPSVQEIEVTHVYYASGMHKGELALMVKR